MRVTARDLAGLQLNSCGIAPYFVFIYSKHSQCPPPITDTSCTGRKSSFFRIRLVCLTLVCSNKPFLFQHCTIWTHCDWSDADVSKENSITSVRHSWNWCSIMQMTIARTWAICLDEYDLKCSQILFLFSDLRTCIFVELFIAPDLFTREFPFKFLNKSTE